MTFGTETLCTYFDSFRFVVTVLASTWVFVRGTAPTRDHRKGVIAVCMVAAVVLVFVNPVIVNASTTGGLQGWLTLGLIQVWIAATFLLALFVMKCCYVLTWTTALSRWILGLCVERFVTAFVHNWLFLAIIPDFKDNHPFFYMAICAFVYTLFITLAALLVAPQFARNITPDHTESRTLCVLYTVSFIVLVVITNWSMQIAEYDIPHLEQTLGNDTNLTAMLYFSTGMAGVIAIVILLFQYAIYHVALLHRETTTLTLLAEQKSRQYETLSENLDFINHKAHDLKHQIAALEFGDNEQRQQLVQETREAIAIYDSAIHTGNDALDTLLTERSFYCSRHDVRLSCMISDCDFSSIDVVDLFTVVGNALDNALEYVMQFDETDKRVISIGAKHYGNLIVLTIDNYFEGTLTLIDGLPATTKNDAFSHGLGLKSIRQIAQRYGGDIRITAQEPVFSLQISLFAS